MDTVPVPRDIAGVTPAWLTAALAQAGIAAHVASLSAEAIGEAAGVNGATYRLRIGYADGAEHGPATLVLKLPPTIPASREIGQRLGFYENEARFYRELASRVPMSIPRCYYSGMDLERQDFALLLEDMAPAVPGDDIAGCSRTVAEAAVDEAAKLHAAWWESAELPSLSWLPVGEPNVEAANARFHETLLPATLRNFGDTLSPTARRVTERYAHSLVPVVRQMTASPWTLAHSDYRLVNLMLSGPEAAPTVTALDWQRVARGKGAIDIAFFLVLSLPPETRRAWQWALVDRYHAGLLAHGVRGYSIEECRRDYRLCAFAPVRIALAHGSRRREDLAGAEGVLLQATLMARAAAAMEDLDMEDFL